MTFFLSPAELAGLQLGSVGTDVLIDRDARLINPQAIHIGDHVRIDAHCILSAGAEGIHIGNFVHISAGAYFYGGGGAIHLEDFTAVSGRVTLYTATGDPFRSAPHGWRVPEDVMRLRKGPVILRKHCGVGAGSIVLPSVELGFGSFVGAMSLVRSDVAACVVVHGNPAQKIGMLRNRSTLERLEAELRQQMTIDPLAVSR